MNRGAGTCIAYLITAGENINSIYEENCGTDCTSIRQLVWTTCIAVIEMFLCLFPTLEKLAFVSLLGALMSAFYSTIAIVMNSVMAGKIPYDPSYGLSGSTADSVFGVFIGMTTMIFAFNFTTVQPDIQVCAAFRRRMRACMCVAFNLITASSLKSRCVCGIIRMRTCMCAAFNFITVQPDRPGVQHHSNACVLCASITTYTRRRTGGQNHPHAYPRRMRGSCTHKTTHKNI